jgi:hypothetical protein
VGLVLFGAENFQPAPGRFRPGGMLSRLWKTISEYL